MPLRQEPIPTGGRELPQSVQEFVLRAEEHLQRWNASCGARLPGFIASDYRQVAEAMAAVSRHSLAPGRSFCEWGSGLGVVTILASQLGFWAHGIEIRRSLVQASRALAAETSADVTFVCGSFVPREVEHLTDLVQETAWLEDGGADGHDDLALEPDSVDLVFAYPWPGEETVVEQIFEAVAGEQALLLTYRGIEELVLQRKIGPPEEFVSPLAG